MSNDYLSVFLYRWDDGNDVRDASTVAFGEVRSVKSHYPTTVIGVCTRPKGTTIEHHSSTPEFGENVREDFVEHVHEIADDVRWFDSPLECGEEKVAATDGGNARYVDTGTEQSGSDTNGN